MHRTPGFHPHPIHPTTTGTRLKSHAWTRLLALLLLALLLPTSLPANAEGKKKGQHVEQRPDLPEPDAMHKALTPQTPLALVPHITLDHTPTIRPHKATQHYGIDVSHYQGRIDWNAASRDSRVTYVYLKATESETLVDDTYAYNLREARRAGIPVGCYHFFSPTTSADKQLKNFTNNVDLKDHDLVPMVDVELRGKSHLPHFINSLRTFIKGIEKHYGVKPILYTSVNFYNKYLAGHFDDYIYMIARYADEIPQPQDDCRFGLWQFSASGKVDGIRGAVDRSCFIEGYSLKDLLIQNNKVKTK